MCEAYLCLCKFLAVVRFVMAMTALLEAPTLFLCDCPEQEVMSSVCSLPLLTQEMDQERGEGYCPACLSVCLVINLSLNNCLGQQWEWLIVSQSVQRQSGGVGSKHTQKQTDTSEWLFCPCGIWIHQIAQISDCLTQCSDNRSLHLPFSVQVWLQCYITEKENNNINLINPNI